MVCAGGAFLSPFWFAGHLLMIVNKSVLLHIVIRSVLLNGWSLLLTALLTLIVVYLFIIIGYVFFEEDFVGSANSPGVCDSLLECFAFGLLDGLRAGGGLGDLLPRRAGGGSFRILFDFAFFLIIVVIILNIVFGIIIDTFAQLRDQKHSIEEDTNKYCMICGQACHSCPLFLCCGPADRLPSLGLCCRPVCDGGTSEGGGQKRYRTEPHRARQLHIAPYSRTQSHTKHTQARGATWSFTEPHTGGGWVGARARGCGRRMGVGVGGLRGWLVGWRAVAIVVGGDCCCD